MPNQANGCFWEFAAIASREIGAQDVATREDQFVSITIEPATTAIGANVRGVDLSRPLDGATLARLKQALLDHLVLFFRDQRQLSVDEHVRFANHFGEIDLPLFRTQSSGRPEVLVLDQVAPKGQGADSWHTDNTYMETPPMGSILQARMLPPVGGDTCFASMIAAYNALSPAMQSFLEGLTATHSLAQMVERTKHVAGTSLRDSLSKWPPVSHPVVRVHPESGRKLLFVNANWTVSIDGLGHDESKALLDFLLDHVKSPEFQVRLHWHEGDVAFWDNRAVQHYAVADYTARRVMQRVTITGDKPFGVDSTGSIAA
jgi:taurine dioxygenase